MDNNSMNLYQLNVCQTIAIVSIYRFSIIVHSKYKHCYFDKYKYMMQLTPLCSNY